MAFGLCKNCYQNQWRSKNPDKVKEYEKRGYIKHKEKRKQKSRNFYKQHPEYDKKWTKDNIIKRRKSWRDYFYKNREVIRKKSKKYFHENKEKRYQYRKNRYQNNIHFKLRMCISTAISSSIKGKKNGRKWETLVGYRLEDLMKDVESKFSKGMTWKN